MAGKKNHEDGVGNIAVIDISEDEAAKVKTVAKRVITELRAVALPDRRKSSRTVAGKYLAILDQIVDTEPGPWYAIAEFDYKSGASVERRQIETGKFTVPALADGYVWQFASRITELDGGKLGSTVYASISVNQ